MTRHFTYFTILVFILGFISCTTENIETGETLEIETQDLIKSLGLLSKDEKILKYYSNFEKTKAGNFFTTKRIAHYWLDDYDSTKNDTSFAFYKDIAYIDTIYKVYETFAPYMEVTKKDSSKFRVYVEGQKNEIKHFFEEAILTWKKNKDK